MYLWSEFVGIYCLIPLLLATRVLLARPIPILIAVASLITWLLIKDGRFRAEWLTNREGMRRHWRQTALRSAGLVILLGAAVVLFRPELLFHYLKTSPLFWAALMVLYPVLSVYPQEVVYRAFLFHRYGELFERPQSMMLASAAAFAFAHVIMGNWISVVLSGVGGLLFAQTYQRSRSLLLTSMEHAVFGNFIFTIGLGQYFIHR